jgi:hypothetical protein
MRSIEPGISRFDSRCRPRVDATRAIRSFRFRFSNSPIWTRHSGAMRSIEPGMTVEVERRASAFPRRKSHPSLASSAPKEEGAGNAGCVGRTRSLACNKEKHASKSPQVRRFNRHSLRDGVNAAPCSPRCPGFLATVASRISACRARRADIAITRLDPSVGGTGPHGFAVRQCAARLATHQASIASRTQRSWRSAETPLFMRARDGGDYGH